MSHIYIPFLISSCYHSRLTKISSPISPRSHGSGRCHCKESDCPEADLSKEKAERHHGHACGASCPHTTWTWWRCGSKSRSKQASSPNMKFWMILSEVLNCNWTPWKMTMRRVRLMQRVTAASVRAHIGRKAWWQAWRQPMWNPCIYV